MNLEALYDLKERLEYAAVAGTALLQEDFRLQRAVEAMAPLAAANPVFGKISSGAKALLSVPPEARGPRLLDVLSLVDAVVYTQGISNISGELEVLVKGTGCYVEASYFQLQPLITALSGSGSSRTSVIQTYWKEHPGYFSDYRVLPYVVGALGDNYGELAELMSAILTEQGTAVIPLLKEGFDPNGKMEMARRVRLIAKLGGEDENDWFVSVLPETKKDVREAVIRALGMSQENAHLLLDLCQSERGKIKEAALRSLAVMENAEAITFWKKEAEKHPDSIACLDGVSSILAADLTAIALQEFLSKMLKREVSFNQKTLDKLIKLTGVVSGKYSVKICLMWRWIGENMDQFASLIPEKTVLNCDLSVAEHLQRALMQTILRNSALEVLELAKTLGSMYREWFLCAAFLADMAVDSASRLYEKYAPLIVKNSLLKKETPVQRNDRIQIMWGLSTVRWNRDMHAHCVAFYRWDTLSGTPVASVRELDGLDVRWCQLLTDPKVSKDGHILNLTSSSVVGTTRSTMDTLLITMINPIDSTVCKTIGEYLHGQILKTGKLNPYMTGLLICNWKNWTGLLSHCAMKEGEIRFYQISSVLEQLPITNAEKAAELKQLDRIVQSKSVRVWNNIWPAERIEMMIAQLEVDPNTISAHGGH